MAVTRKTALTEILFPVELRPIFLQLTQKERAQLLTGGSSKNYERIPQFRAVVDVERNNVFSVVTESYRLVLNSEAIKLGQECFKTVFTESTAEAMQVFNIISPKSRSFCHVDYIHKDVSFEPWQNDKWMPFLRITNSYNKMKPLRFDVGFCRWICKNGLVFGEKSIRFRYVHTKGEVGKTTEFRTTFGELKTLENQFIESLHNLKRFYVPKTVMLPMLLRAFKVRVTDGDLLKPKRLEQLLALRRVQISLTEKYFNDIGPNGYAALNVLTDFASRPEAYISPENMVNQLQKRSGEWMAEFVTQLKRDDFNFDTYLEEYSACAKLLEGSLSTLRF